MYLSAMLRTLTLLVLGLALVPLLDAQQPNLSSVSIPANASATSAPVANGPASAASDSSSSNFVSLLHQTLDLMQQKQMDAALEKVNAAILLEPKNMDGYGLRGGIYAGKKQWDLAIKDYQTVLQINGTNAQARFNLAEVQFMQKKYDDARTGFEALQHDPNLGDLAAYKVFLCDLLAGHEDVATKELDALDIAAAGASLYFGKAAWYLYHKQIEDGRSWLLSAARIYPSAKFTLYAASLFDLGYLPIPPPQKS